MYIYIHIIYIRALLRRGYPSSVLILESDRSARSGQEPLRTVVHESRYNRSANASPGLEIIDDGQGTFAVPLRNGAPKDD